MKNTVFAPLFATALAAMALAAPSAHAAQSFTFLVGTPSAFPQEQTVTLTEGSTFVLGQDDPYADLGYAFFDRDGGATLDYGSPYITVNGTTIPLSIQNVNIIYNDTNNGFPGTLYDVYYKVVGGDYDFGPYGHINFGNGPIMMTSVYDSPGQSSGFIRIGLTLHDVPSAVPEPAPWIPVAFGVFTVTSLAWRRRRQWTRL
ncbi:MAG: hypothetical protein ABIY70_18645 [Capsulimonas sp.]|uniref:hypothetical protein n=1 Tax=Capsulimonas sp. TaxID=2494211 RepID=UPI003267BCC9